MFVGAFRGLGRVLFRPGRRNARAEDESQAAEDAQDEKERQGHGGIVYISHNTTTLGRAESHFLESLIPFWSGEWVPVCPCGTSL